MKRLVVITALMVISFSLSAFAIVGSGINKDLKNISGVTVYDVSVVIKGIQTTNWRYLGGWGTYTETKYPSLVTGPNTKLKWSNRGNSNQPIPNNATVHIGWKIPGPPGEASIGEILDMWWTDISGNRVAGSAIQQTSAHWVFYAPGNVWIRWHNFFVPDPLFGATGNLTIQNVRYLVSSTQFDTDTLLLSNVSLNAGMSSLPGTLSIAPGTSDSMQIPGLVAANKFVLVRYEVTGAGDGAVSTDYAQSDAIGYYNDGSPTLSEWALIVFSIVLLGLMTYYVVRRRRMASIAMR